MANLIIHGISLMFAVLTIMASAVGMFSSAYVQQYLECAWLTAAFFASCWLAKRLFLQCERIYDGLG